MDLKGINWVGQMYQKCETMLLEVEDDMYQDVVSYVENQVQTVGDSVKKFYSDVIEDLLPPSADELISGDSDLPVETYADTCVYKKTREGTMEVHINVDAERVMKNLKAINVEVENHASFYHGISSVNSSSGSSLADSLHGSCSELCSTLYEDGVVHNCSTTSVKEGSGRASKIFPCLHRHHEASCDKIAISVSGLDGIEDVSKCGYDVSVDGPSSDKSMLLRSIDNKVTEVRLSSCGSLPAESNDMTSSHGMVPMIRSAENWDTGCSDITDKQAITANSGFQIDFTNDDEKYSLVVYSSNLSKEDESEKDEIDSENVIELDPEDIYQGDHLNLEESCIVVDGDELHRVPLSKVKGKSRAYKNKIRDALTLRRKSTRKEEYKQLAVLYAEDAGPNHQSVESIKPGLTRDSKRSSQTHDVGESEWEFL